MADERGTPLNQGTNKWLQITDGGKLQTWNGVDTPTPIIGDDPLVTKTELDDKASLSLNHGFVSEYISRVMQEGGTIQNGRRTAAPFISPTYEDAKMILNASGGLDIADDGGRKVINKIWDSSQERENQVFAGSDRPEFHKTLDGFEQVSVEKESTNLFLNSETLSTQDVTVDELAYTVAFEGTGTIDFTGAHTGSLVGVEGERVELTFTPTAGTLTCTVSGTVSKAQIEQSEYATLYIPTEGSPVTRLAPSPVIENAMDGLESGGSVGGVLDGVRDPLKTTIFFFVSGDNSTEVSSFFLNSSNSTFCQVYGATGGRIENTPFPLTWQSNSFIKLAYLITHDSDTLTLKLLSESGNIHTLTTPHQINSTVKKAATLGNISGLSSQSSRRFKKPWVSDSIVRVNATDEEIKQFFEDLTRGTSMETAKEDMVIV